MNANGTDKAEGPPRRRAAYRVALGFYCLLIYVVLDVIYSNVTSHYGPSVRVYSPDYHHGLRAKMEGWDRWGEAAIKLTTNSLGMKDASIRDVAQKFAGKRVVLIGDSFTEGVGLPFDQTFAGLLYRAGQARAEKIEFLNAGVVSYSPTLYYRRIKNLIDTGLAFDEVVVFSDLSDVQDEAMWYFCFDDDPQYRARCNEKETGYSTSPQPNFFQRNFVVTDRLRLLVKAIVQQRSGQGKKMALTESPRSAWTIASLQGARLDDLYKPLGIEGGIARSLKNMQRLADLLAERRIALTIAVYPHALQLNLNDRDSRQIGMWRDFCAANCKAFIDLFPAFFAARDAHPDWYDRFFWSGDVHFSAAGNQLLFEAVAPHLLNE